MDLTVIGLAVAGLASHQLVKIIGAKADGDPGYGVVRYWTGNWPQTLLALIGTAVVLVLGQEAPDVLGPLTPLSAYLAGFTGGSAAGSLGTRASR